MIFVYGTLLLDEVLNHLTVNAITRIKARLYGYKRVCIAHVDYPIAVEAGDADFIDGEIQEVNSLDLHVLDSYEELDKGIYSRFPV